MSVRPKILGILGGGQLGRMSALAAARLGIITNIYTPEPDSPAAQVSARTFVGAWDNKAKLKQFAESVDYISYEFENIPLDTIQYVSQFCAVLPDENILAIAQDRIREKKFLNDIGIPTAQWSAVSHPDDVLNEAKAIGCDAFILKTTRFGYDGKGQVSCTIHDDIKTKWGQLNFDHIIFEERIDFDYEISVIVARDKIGGVALYGPVLNEHKSHILSRSICPAPIDKSIATKALDMTRNIAESLDLVGVLALELFVTKDGRVLANEIAPRTHNSGHYTIDANAVSQFENHVRTICGLPVGDTSQHTPATMINLIGDDVRELGQYYEMENACVHLYGKHDIKDGRKMGHVTILNNNKVDRYD